MRNFHDVTQSRGLFAFFTQLTFSALIAKDLETSTKNKELHRLLHMEKCLVFFITSIKSNEMVLAKMRSRSNLQRLVHDEDLMEDVVLMRNTKKGCMD